MAMARIWAAWVCIGVAVRGHLYRTRPRRRIRDSPTGDTWRPEGNRAAGAALGLFPSLIRSPAPRFWNGVEPCEAG